MHVLNVQGAISLDKPNSIQVLRLYRYPGLTESAASALIHKVSFARTLSSNRYVSMDSNILEEFKESCPMADSNSALILRMHGFDVVWFLC